MSFLNDWKAVCKAFDDVPDDFELPAGNVKKGEKPAPKKVDVKQLWEIFLATLNHIVATRKV